MRRDRHGEANSRFSIFCESAWNSESDTRTVKKISNGKPLTKNHKEDLSTDGRIITNSTFVK